MLALVTRFGCLERRRQEMGADHTTSSVFNERVARDYEAWYEQGFGSFASRQEEALLHQQLQHFTSKASSGRTHHRVRFDEYCRGRRSGGGVQYPP